jgi:hypothetical protein
MTIDTKITLQIDDAEMNSFMKKRSINT